MFWIGLMAGVCVGVVILACFRNAQPERENHGIDDCEKCKMSMCARCPYPADLEALESMYKAERHARRTAFGERKAAQAALCRMIGQQQEIAR